MKNTKDKNQKNAKLLAGIKRHLPNYLGLAPFYILMAIFVFAPIVLSIAMSFTDWSTGSRGQINFVGLENYKFILSGVGNSSERFLKSLKNLAIYVPITITVGLSISLGLALILRHINEKAYQFFRSAYFVPTVLPLYIAAGIWQWFMNSEVGLVASNLAKIGIGRDVIWADTAGYAIAMVVIIDIWNAAGFNFIIFSTGMQDISPELYEAAEIDGASTFQQMRYITIPLLEPIIFFVIIYSFISALQVYDIPWILTSQQAISNIGGSQQVMLFPVMEMVRNVYSGGASGLARASTEGVILMAIIMVITLIQFKLRRKNV